MALVKDNKTGTGWTLWMNTAARLSKAGYYPIEITKNSALAEKNLPCVFGIPAPKISKDWIAKAEKEVQLLDQESSGAEFEILAEALDTAGGKGPKEAKTLRGGALKELHAFILSKDASEGSCAFVTGRMAGLSGPLKKDEKPCRPKRELCWLALYI